jgi:Zn-dependent protease
MTFNPFVLFVRALVLLTALPIHEFAHAFVASKLGDNTAKNQGRLTINPLTHLDMIGSAAIMIFGFGWAKPVPINPYNFKNPKFGMAISSLAGPVSNLILALLSLIFYKISIILLTNGVLGENFVFLIQLFSIATIINISLAIFNLLPIPPLDGSRIATYFMPERLYFKIMQYEQYVFLALIALIYIGVLNGPLRFLTQIIYKLLDLLTFFLGTYPMFN